MGLQSGDEAFSSHTISNCVKIGSVCIPLKHPFNPTSLAPICLFQAVDLHQLFLKVVSKDPFFLLQPRRVRFIVKVLDPSKHRQFAHSSFFPHVAAPAPKELPEAYRHMVPPVYDISTPCRRGKPCPLVPYQGWEALNFKPAKFEEEARTPYLVRAPGVKN